MNLTARLVPTIGAAALALSTLAGAVARDGDESVPRFDHQFVIMMENHGYDRIIGSPYAPSINQFARTYALATNYHGVAHPSLPNYLGLISGSVWGVLADNPPQWSTGTPGASARRSYVPTIPGPSIVDQLARKGLTWKSYEESIPATGSNWANSAVDGKVDKLYAVKHNPFAYFASVQQTPAARGNMVGFDQLKADLESGAVPNFAFVAPNQCHDMHGDPAGNCAHGDASAVDSGEQALLRAGDRDVKTLVDAIMASPAWSHGRNVIYVVWDENDDGRALNRVPLIAITSNGPRGIESDLYGDHYGLLRTIEDGFGIRTYLGEAANARPLTTLVAISASP